MFSGRRSAILASSQPGPAAYSRMYVGILVFDFGGRLVAAKQMTGDATAATDFCCIDRRLDRGRDAP